MPGAARPSSPAASSSASRWRGPWCSSRRVLLLDEPLGALDAKLRKHLQLELKAIQQEVGVTFVYVTHDQEEALTMSDRLAVMRDGRVEQIGAARGGLRRPGDGLRRRLPRLGQRARRRGARPRRRRRDLPGSAAWRCARSAPGSPAGEGHRPARADLPRARPTRPSRSPRGTTRSTASSTASSTSARRRTWCCGCPTARHCWSRCRTRRADVVAVRRRAARCARPSRPRRRGCSAASRVEVDPTSRRCPTSERQRSRTQPS